MIKNGIFNAALKQNASLSELRQGICESCFVVYSNSTDKENPKLLPMVKKILGKYSQVMVFGGKVDNLVFSLDTFKKITEIPNKSELQAQIVGLLSLPSQKLLGTLKQSPMILCQLMTMHEERLKKDSP